jgi:Pentapeptide repeats (8 copies)
VEGRKPHIISRISSCHTPTIFNEANLNEAKLTGADLREANFSGANLTGADLSSADLNKANLSGADLGEAYLVRADLSRANLNRAYLGEARFRGASLYRTNLYEANLWSADLSETTLVQTNFSMANLDGCFIYGIAAWSLNLEGASQLNLIITPSNEPRITVDNLEVAQFVYLLLHNEKIRDVIDTITSKAVLILGRFTEERKAVFGCITGGTPQTGFPPYSV